MRMKYQPIREIQFMAKSGFITREIWMEYFAQGKTSWRNMLWRQLMAENYFLSHGDKYTNGIWKLNRRHPLVDKTVGENIVNPPFISQITHDELIAKFILEVMKQGVGREYLLEAELKKLAPGLKRYYETSEREKYPDGLILLNGSKKTKVALELERTRKDPKRYRQILDAYSSFKKADCVVFILEEERFMKTIRQAIRDSYYPNTERPVGFSLVSEWKKNPTAAKILFSDGATTLTKMSQKSD